MSVSGLSLGEIVAALDDPARRRVLELLRDGPRRSGELATQAGVQPAAMSRHLRVLLEAGLVDDERSRGDARVRLFFLKKEWQSELLDWLHQLESPDA